MIKVLLNDDQQIVGQTTKEGTELASTLKTLSGGTGANVGKDGFGGSTGTNGRIESIPKDDLKEAFKSIKK